ncbi:DNA adenine methylase [[Acholeplasma] multilocale]|uniref:DNA adenine methylase n=1 Tax=[Acholeplasma] multilocale TaxID=264638 RepID=UPI000479D300|nr:DNA adenine methylase [[Acholeplasma] multilocale]
MESKEYLTQQIITYLGNKRALLPLINAGITYVKDELQKERLVTVDLFSGSGIVARNLKKHSTKVIVNDLEGYSKIINECYLTNSRDFDFEKYEKYYKRIVKDMKKNSSGIIQELYAPKEDTDIKKGERVFYTTRNAKFIDSLRQAIDKIPKDYQKYFIAPLLSECSIKNNTSGVFKGFFKNSKTGIGQFGGNGENALSRIKSDIEIKRPIFSNFNSEFEVHQEDAKELILKLKNLDLVYIDPPYNQHPYSSNYFMLNIINDYKRPENISKVSGIPDNWNKSDFNKMSIAKESLRFICEKADSKFVIISFNNEGFIRPEEIKEMLSEIGVVTVIEEKYNAYRGSRNLKNRTKYVKEFLFILDKRGNQYVQNDF